MNSETRIQPHWLSKSLAGILAGGLLSFAFVGLVVWFGPDGLKGTLTSSELLWKTQFNMWLIAPVWLLILSMTFLFKTGKQAWGCLLLATAVCFALQAGLRSVL
ncbi:hypothetical protein CWB99_03120 [Pseudoalteromonas rubra]|uniref:Uncharacterized protein n=1 Tax=Pseudoalteromonas rubra TaxID=43658 RepID=A0A5S3WSC9_9GAMM|nr:hypothetical protein [Pseudoalteromonas rubra]TMP30165.1 hypothetical protein CWC00_17365 [Pseudoalteromonas rubra]TMP31967.1 hypothetical protein CWB99_03120 [Pseudoalteromonas rubra]